MNTNVYQLEKEIEWFSLVLETRIQLYFQQECKFSDISEITPPVLTDNYYSDIIRGYTMNIDERLILILALIPYIKPEVLDVFFTHNKNTDRIFTEFGGWVGKSHNGYLPTGETAVFILAGGDINRRFEVIKVFDQEHFFKRDNILSLKDCAEHEPFLSGILTISTEFISKCTVGESIKPDYNSHFPAKLIHTNLEWEDLILSPDVLDDINQIRAWIEYGPVLMDDWKMKKYIKPGYRCLFYGPPGTGKTLTAGLIGKHSGFDVYRIDLSMLVSKYIGETEKNLKNVFDQAENKRWILFFDEADSLFGKRTQTANSNDRHANQETSYLLQRVEDFPGVVILATNLKNNMDEAYSRRFQSVIYFPKPDFEQRLQLWKNILPSKLPLDSSVNLSDIAFNYELTGGAIINVARYCALKSIRFNQHNLTHKMLCEGIKIEIEKEGKLFTTYS